MSAIAVIPARYDSSRLPGKPLLLINGKPMIQHVYEATLKSNCFKEVIVATDNKKIKDVVSSFGGIVVMTRKDHISGTDRVAEAVRLHGNKPDVVVNIQGDQPFITAETISLLIRPFDLDKNVNMATAGCSLDKNNYENPNVVKVITDIHGYALYFSRSPIPYYRNDNPAPVFEHIGVYAFKHDFLKTYTELPPSDLEICEGLEQLRALENGYKIKVVQVKDRIREINTKEDYKWANR